ncbi:MAG TPA: WxL domain-containing protein [Acidimicrobiales bacterium]|nr:WxL domain-containing protein [Acidimicrobiales bacterium]
MKNFTKRLAIGTVAAGTLLATAFAPGAFASDGTTATVTGGSLSITNPLAADFAGRSITGVAQTTTAALATFSVSDLTGSGAGWNVTAQASTFTGVSHNLAASSLSMSQPTVASPDTTSADPTIATGPYTIDSGSAVSVASADLLEGMGKYDFSATTLTLSLPADVFADAYASTVTISVVSAP